MAKFPRNPVKKYKIPGSNTLYMSFFIKIEIADELTLIKMPKFIQYNFKCYVLSI